MDTHVMNVRGDRRPGSELPSRSLSGGIGMEVILQKVAKS